MRILVAVDFSPITGTVMEIVPGVACRAPSDVRVLHVSEPEPDFVGYDAGPGGPGERVTAVCKRARLQVEVIADRLRARHINATALVIQGSRMETIIHEAGRFDADIVAVGSHGHGAVFELLTGSVPEAQLRQSERAVLVIPSAPA